MKEMKYETYLEFFCLFVLPTTCSVFYWELMTPLFSLHIVCERLSAMH